MSEPANESVSLNEVVPAKSVKELEEETKKNFQNNTNNKSDNK